MDPKLNHSLSAYNVFGSNSVLYSDFLGDTIRIDGSRGFIRKTERALNKVKSTKEGKRIYENVHSSTETFTIHKYTKSIVKVHGTDGLPANWKIGDIGFDGKRFSKNHDFGKGGWIALGHELSHTLDVLEGRVSSDLWQTPDKSITYSVYERNRDGEYVFSTTNTVQVPPLLVDEVRAVHRENMMRAQAGVALRIYYSSVVINTYDPSQGKTIDEVQRIQQLVVDGHGVHPSYSESYVK